MERYQMTVWFTTDRVLTPTEAESLEATVYTQITEPQTLADPDADWVDADYETSGYQATPLVHLGSIA